MHSLKMRRRIGCIIIFSILLCEMCFHDQPCKAYFFAVQTSASISGTPIHISKERQIASFERSDGRSRTWELLRRSSRRRNASCFRRIPFGLSFVDVLPQMFHSTIYFRTKRRSHNTSGHIERIRCVQRKDGKKRTIS